MPFCDIPYNLLQLQMIPGHVQELQETHWANVGFHLQFAKMFEFYRWCFPFSGPLGVFKYSIHVKFKKLKLSSCDSFVYPLFFCKCKLQCNKGAGCSNPVQTRADDGREQPGPSKHFWCSFGSVGKSAWCPSCCSLLVRSGKDQAFGTTPAAVVVPTARSSPLHIGRVQARGILVSVSVKSI